MAFLYSSYQEMVNLFNFYTNRRKILNVFQGNHRSEKKKTVPCELQVNCKWTKLNLFPYCLIEGKILKDIFKSE